MLDERLQTLLHELEQLDPQDQQRLADQLEAWLDDLEWRRVLNEPGPDELYEAAVEEMRQGQTQPLRPEDFAEEAYHVQHPVAQAARLVGCADGIRHLLRFGL
jgi:hypothetical protein